jgi:hypothetical protein
MFGTADLHLDGQTQVFECNFFGGTGFIYDSNLVVTNYAFLSSNTTGSCYISSNGFLGVKIYGEGNVYYSGTPAQLSYSNEGGSGELIKQ